MKALEIYVNGEKVCTAGVGVDGVLIAEVRWLGKPPNLGGFCASVTGLDSAASEHLIWRRTQIELGDEVTIRAVEADAADPPEGRIPVDRKKLEAP